MDGKYFLLTLPCCPYIPQKTKLQAEGFDNGATLDETIKKLKADLKKAHKKEAERQMRAKKSLVSCKPGSYAKLTMTTKYNICT